MAIALFPLPIRHRSPLDPLYGPGYIAGELPDGLVTVNGSPAGRQIEVRHRLTRRVMATTFSAPDGSYRFDWLHPGELFDVIGRDYSATYNDVIVSRVLPAPYP